MTATTVDLHDVQGWVLRLYRFGHSASLFARVDDSGAARGWLERAAGRLTTVDSFDARRRSTLNVAFTAGGLTALGMPREELERFPAVFVEGMAARWEKLGDLGPSEPGYWVDGLGTGEAHLLVSVHVRDAQDVDPIVRDARSGIESSGMTVVHHLNAAQLPRGQEHFGFSDGFSQPAVAGVLEEEHRPGQGTPGKRPGEWKPVAPGEFVLGYVDDDGVLPAAPPPPFDRNSSFMVWRQLEQDVAGFYEYCDNRADLFPNHGAHEVAAKMVGRWRDGTPLVLHPEGENPAVSSDPDRINAFRFTDDREGHRCPIGSHVRRTNPRDAFPIGGAELTRRHRIIRRGMSYGDLPADPRRRDGHARGLAFVCFQADLERQFETVQAGWCADGDAFGLDTAKDPILSNDDPEGVFVVPGRPPVFLGPMQNFVTTRGGEYLIAPGIEAVRRIAAGTAW